MGLRNGIRVYLFRMVVEIYFIIDYVVGGSGGDGVDGLGFGWRKELDRVGWVSLFFFVSGLR